MYRILIVLLVAITMQSGCQKSEQEPILTAEDQIKGTWVREGTTGVGSGNTLTFSKKNGVNTLSFDCSGSPGPGWPSNAETEYKFENNKLVYLNYYDNSLGFYTANSFNWITTGKEFEIQFRQVLLFMAAIYVVKYKKVN